jgi:hypothetical protein
VTLARTQQSFMAQILDESLPLSPGWGARAAAGIAIYRNAYRSRMVEALAATYPLTSRWVGEDPFKRAAAHFVIKHPSHHWSLDDVGAGFPATLADVFANDPEVAELAKLEWLMHRLFVANDAVPLDQPGFAAASTGFEEKDWAGMKLSLVPGIAVMRVKTCCAAIWRALHEDSDPPATIMLPEDGAIIVWREGFQTVFRTVTLVEEKALRMASEGCCFADICEMMAEALGENTGPNEAGHLLGKWIGDGLVAGLA